MHILYTNWYTGIYIYTNTICLYAYLAIEDLEIPCPFVRSWEQMWIDALPTFRRLLRQIGAADIDVLDHGMLLYDL